MNDKNIVRLDNLSPRGMTQGAQTSAKPQSNETEDEYAARALRTLCSREMKIDKREAKGEKQSRYRNNDDTGRGRSCGEVRKQYVLLKRTNNKRPHKIPSQVTSKAVGRYYVCLYHDVGYADQDNERAHPEDDLRPFPGFIEPYEVVSGIPPTVYYH